jgi:hypothetical protein
VERAAEIWSELVARDPMSWVSRSNFIHILVALGRLEEAHAQLEIGETLHGSDLHGMSTARAHIALEEGRNEAVLAALKGAQVPHDALEREAMLAMALDAFGRRDEADQALAALEAATVPEPAILVAHEYARRGELEGAWRGIATSRQRWLAQPVGARSHFLHLIYPSPPLAPLRADPRWLPMIEAYRDQLVAKNE